jgi:electron transport complex protein RnfG
MNNAVSKITEPSSARLILTLGLAGLLSGLIIVAVYEATLPRITAYKERTLKEAVFKVLPGVTRLQQLAYHDGRLEVSQVVPEEGSLVYGGYDATDNFVGYAIPAEGPGFQDTIRLLYGYLPDERKVVGMEILESRETPGLGDKIYKDADFVANFDALAIDPEIAVVKKSMKYAANEVDAITGATISSKAVVRIINQANQIWVPRFADTAPPPQPEKDHAQAD